MRAQAVAPAAAEPSSLPRTTLLAKCSCATVVSPRAQASPSSCRYGSTTSREHRVEAERRRAAGRARRWPCPRRSWRARRRARACDCAIELAAVGLRAGCSSARRAASAAASPSARWRLHRADSLDVVVRVEAEAPVRAVGSSSPYRFSQARRRSTLVPVRRLSSPIRRCPRSVHGVTVQDLDKDLTNADSVATVSDES